MTNTESPLRPVRLNTVDHETYFSLVWRRFRKSKVAIIGGLIVIILIVMALFAEFFAPYDPVNLNMKMTYSPPSQLHFIDSKGNLHLKPFIYGTRQVLTPTFQVQLIEDTENPIEIDLFVEGWEYKFLGLIPTKLHLYGLKDNPDPVNIYLFLMGGDKFGRDMFGRICMAGRISLTMSLFGTIISVLIGSVMGVTSGYFGGNFDLYFQRFVEFVQSFPQLPLWMALAAIIPISWDQMAVFISMSIIFAMLSWTLLAREVRGKVLALRETDFVLAAKEMGASDWRIIFFHLYPNTLSHTIVVLTLTIPSIILSESFLSFLGIGIQEPLVSWGVMMRDAQTVQTLSFHQWIIVPVVFIFLAVLGWNLLGDGLRDAADPYTIT